MPTPAPVFTVAPFDPSAGRWDAVSALGTLAAVVVALGIALWPAIASWWRKPVLTPELSNREPHVRLARIVNGPQAFYLRLLVRNTGNVEARRVRVTLTDWYVNEPMQGAPDWARYDTDPAALHWVSMSHARERHPVLAAKPMTPRTVVTGYETHVRPTPPEVNLPGGLWDLVDFAEYTGGEPMTVVLDDNRPRGMIQQAHKLEGEFLLTISITAENVKGITRTIAFRTEPGKEFVNVDFADPPARGSSLRPLPDHTMPSASRSCST